MSRDSEWLAAILADPASYSLPAYGPWMTLERAAAYFAAWEADEAAGTPSPALCRRCGHLLRFGDHPSQQLHAWCWPKRPGPHPRRLQARPPVG